LITKSYRQPHA